MRSRLWTYLVIIQLVSIAPALADESVLGGHYLLELASQGPTDSRWYLPVQPPWSQRSLFLDDDSVLQPPWPQRSLFFDDYSALRGHYLLDLASQGPTNSNLGAESKSYPGYVLELASQGPASSRWVFPVQPPWPQNSPFIDNNQADHKLGISTGIYPNYSE
jgi:hypothetical protein